MTTNRRPLGVTLLGVFLVLSTGILAATVITLLLPGTFVDRIWDFKRSEYEQMLPHRHWAGAGFLVLGVVMAFAAYGWFKGRRWAWWLVQGIFVANGIGDLGRIFRGDVVGGLVGIAIITGLILYVRSARVRNTYLFADYKEKVIDLPAGDSDERGGSSPRAGMEALNAMKNILR